MLKDFLNHQAAKRLENNPRVQLWVPQGAEYQAVQRGWYRHGPAIGMIALPVGTPAVTSFLQHWWQSVPVEARPTASIILLGLAGSLTSELPLGQPVLYQSCGCLSSSSPMSWYYPDAMLTMRLQQQLAYPLVQGLTSDQVISQREDKMALGQHYSRAVVDMEGSAVLAFCQAQGLSVAMVRVISDDVHQSLPDLKGVYDAKGQLRPLALTAALLRQPRAGLNLIRSSLKALRVLESVATSLSEVKF